MSKVNARTLCAGFASLRCMVSQDLLLRARIARIFFVHTVMKKKIYIGPIIKQKLNESPYSVAQFAREIGRSRVSVYDLFKEKSIDIDLLCKISKLLRYNFLDLYIKDIQNSVNENHVIKKP